MRNERDRSPGGFSLADETEMAERLRQGIIDGWDDDPQDGFIGLDPQDGIDMIANAAYRASRDVFRILGREVRADEKATAKDAIVEIGVRYALENLRALYRQSQATQ